MKLLIREIVIWPEDTDSDPQVMMFDPDRVSVVTGWSGTGKSTIISIIDYVLGAGSSTIPVGIIREAASWYGLLLDTDVGLLRLAREKPGGRDVSEAYWLQQGDEATQPLPRRPRPNARTERVKQLFDDLSKLSNLETDPDGGGFSGRASFRDMAAFNFLPQHVVANPYTMFFKADTSKHREKLRNVLPLALGTMTNEDLVRLHTRRLVRDELRRVEAELRVRREALERWRASATGAFYQAQELGLLPTGPLPSVLDDVIAVLRDVVAAGGRTAASVGRVSAAVARSQVLREQEREIDRRIADRRRRLRRLRSLRGTVADYGDILADQRDRVRGVGWFKAAIADDHCVLCGSDSGAALRALEELEGPLAELEDLAEGTRTAPPVVDREILAIERELIEAEQALIEGRRTRVAAERTVDLERGRTQSLESVYRFIGNTEQALQMLGEVEGEGGLEARAAMLRQRAEELDRLLDQNRRREREGDVSRLITSTVRRTIELLGISGAEGVPIFDQRELNIKFQRDGLNHPDFLWEIGSGENWMAYHLATMLALHHVFLRRGGNNPVPTFLVIDQPSQVYFPSDTYKEFVEKDGSRDVEESREDLERTRRIFQTLAQARQGLAGLQIIVLDHADRDTWGGVDGVEEVANWRGGAALIPSSWTT